MSVSIRTEFGTARPNAYGHYIISSGKHRGKRLHRLRYEAHHKIKIPDDYDIHHIDEDKSNNDINNLVMMTHSEHSILHKTNDEWRVIKKGINENGEQLYALYNPDGEKIKTSTDKKRLERSKERYENKEKIEEKPKHSLIFEQYYELGDKRTLTELSKITGYNISQLSKWKNEFDWDNKIDNRDKLTLKIKSKDTLEANQEARAIYQNTIREIMKRQVIEPLMNGTFDIEVGSISDIKKLVELDNMLSIQDREENKQIELDENDKQVINLIENDGDTWEMLTNKLRENQGD